jgi:signal transduction histidine kinase
MRPIPWPGVALVAAAAAVLVAGLGALIEPLRFGTTRDASFELVEEHVRRRFDDLAQTLQRTARSLATDPDVPDGLTGDRTALVRLFERTRDAVPTQASDVAVTVYDATATPRAWTGPPAELSRELVLSESAFHVVPGPLGLLLVYVEPITALARDSDRRMRIGSVSAERLLSASAGLAAEEDPSPLASPLAPLSLRAAADMPVVEAGRRRLTLPAPDGQPLIEASVADDDLDRARADWRRSVRDLAFALAALVLGMTALPELVRAPRGPDVRTVLRGTAAASCALFAAGALLWTAATPGPVRPALFSGVVYTSTRLPGLLRSPADLLLLGLMLTAIATTAARFADVARIAWRHRRWRTPRRDVLKAHAAAGVLLAMLLGGYAALLADTVAGSTVDLLQWSSNPAARIGLLLGLLLAATATVWLGASILLVVEARWNRRLHDVRLAALGISAAPGVLLALLPAVPTAPYIALLAGIVGTSLAAARMRAWFRHASESGRLAAILGVLLVPAVLAYPAIADQGLAATRSRIEDAIAPATAGHPETLLANLSQAQREIDALLARTPVASNVFRPAAGAATPDAAFSVWRQTALARLRLTSAIELYGPDRSLVSRFALNFPDAPAVPSFQGTSCNWEVYGEVFPSGAEERRVLHAERGICLPWPGDMPAADAVAGAVVIHVPLDYRALPFIPSQNPYRDVLRPVPRPPDSRPLDADLELAIYGWGRGPLFTFGSAGWTIDDALFQRIYASRESFWTTLRAGDRTSAVYISNDRGGIYALGYPLLAPFDHLIRLAEIVSLTGAAFGLWVIVLTLAGPFTASRYRLGRELVRELRASFYRRLLLAFVAVAAVPVLGLAVLIRNYSTAQMRADVEAGAERTAVVAQRVIAELQQAADPPASVVTDDLLIFVSQIIEQDVNIFQGPRLIATSERDLFASGLLPTRTPAAVYNAIALAQAPTFVTQDTFGSQDYLVAAAPIRSVGSDAILTVPLASRQRDIERQIRDLDRGILLGVTLLVLLGAGSGFYIAERIADPVQRLTRATRRIARGDFDARVATRSADEIEGLMTAFNRMAGDLALQRQRLEKTHRIEAWAEMARQVAHEIKNPLTPVQLSAEHLLRVHRDRGEPLGPILRSCVDSILAQVRLLRQIASEFSSFASSPPVKRESTDLADLVREVLDPYRTGLAGRIELTVDVPVSLPRVFVDRTLTGRTITNVVENALHAMPGDGRLDVSATAGAEEIVLVVRDTGVGLDEASLAHVFEPYFSTKVSGTGLGMAIAKRNVELNGGTIAIESRKGEGATVTLRLPTTSAAVPRSAPAPRPCDALRR